MHRTVLRQLRQVGRHAGPLAFALALGAATFLSAWPPSATAGAGINEPASVTLAFLGLLGLARLGNPRR